jgi:hypothetical protein
LFVASYGTALMLANSEDFDNGANWLALPLIGPWAAIGGKEFSCKASTVETTKKCVTQAYKDVRFVAFVTADGLIQAAATAMLIAGAGSSTDELVRDDIKVSVVPT